MGRLLQWMARLGARIDRWISQLENHEAVVESWIRDMESAIARAEGQLRQLRTTSHALRTQMQHAERAAAEWRDQARLSATSDERHSLDFLRHARRADAKASSFRAPLEDHERAETRLARDIELMKKALDTLRTRHALMLTRQLRAEGMDGLRSDGEELKVAQDVFARWDLHLTELERTAGRMDAADEWVQDIQSIEEEISLRAELAQLVALDVGEVNG